MLPLITCLADVTRAWHVKFRPAAAMTRMQPH